MKKLLIIIAVIIAILAIGATIFLGKLDGLIADAIRTEGTNAIGTQVNVDNVVTDLRAGSAQINGLTIANPPGYQELNALSLGSFSTKVNYSEQLVDEIIIDKPTINAELIGTKSNFETLLENMPESTDTETEEPTEESEDIVLTIKKLALTQAQVNLTSDKVGKHSFTMKDLIITDLVGTPEQIAQQVTDQLVAFITDEVKVVAGTLLAATLKAKASEEVSEKVTEALQDKLGGKLKDFNLKFK